MRRQTAYPVAFDLECTIESRAHVLERDGRSQIDDLLGVEVALQLLEHLVGNVDRAKRHFLGVAQRGTLRRREQRILLVVSDRRQFLLAYFQRAATGSIDIDSENATDHLCRAQTDQALQGRAGNLRALYRLHEDRHRERDPGPISPRLVGIQHLADFPLHHPRHRLEQPAELFLFERFYAHGFRAPN